MTRVYLAGPDVFVHDAVDIGRRKVELCARHGLIGLYPLDNAIDPAAKDTSLRIFGGNETMMIEADAIIANLTPFRGPGADAGTVYELGYMAGRGKLCLGYSNDPSSYADRMRKFSDVSSRDGRLVDALGLTVEDFGLSDNLMMIYALDLHGCALVTPRQAPADIWHDLTAFETCVRMAAGRLAADARGCKELNLARGDRSMPPPRKRADVLLVERGLFESRARAQAAIEAGLVMANDRLVVKPSEAIAADAVLQAQPAHPFVSRGGVKLASALEQYPIEIENHVCLDVGASTGGFTEVLLSNGANLVFAIDVGREQLHPSLRGHPKVVSMEETDIRDFEGKRLPIRPDIVVIDVSFISLKAVLPVALSAGSVADAFAGVDQAAIRSAAKAFQTRHHPQRDGAPGNLRRHRSVRNFARMYRHPGVSIIDNGWRRKHRIFHRRAPWLSVLSSITSLIAATASPILTDRRVYVPYTLGGETVEVAPVPGHHPDRRRLLQVIDASPERVAPFCQHFGVCGGCAIQHWQTERYRAWKRDIVIETLAQAKLRLRSGSADRCPWLAVGGGLRCMPGWALTMC